jgi:hypothetical protein
MPKPKKEGQVKEVQDAKEDELKGSREEAEKLEKMKVNPTDASALYKIDEALRASQLIYNEMKLNKHPDEIEGTKVVSLGVKKAEEERNTLIDKLIAEIKTIKKQYNPAQFLPCVQKATLCREAVNSLLSLDSAYLEKLAKELTHHNEKRRSFLLNIPFTNSSTHKHFLEVCAFIKKNQPQNEVNHGVAVKA